METKRTHVRTLLAWSIAATGLMLIPAVVVGGGDRALAVDNCGNVIPYAALEGWGLGDGAEAALTVGGGTSVTGIAAGGATTAITLSTGTVLGGAAGVFGVTVAGCEFLDWATRDGDSMFCQVTDWLLGCSPDPDPGPTLNESDLTYGDWTKCNTWPNSGFSAIAANVYCAQVMMSATVPSNTVFRSTSEGAFTVGANNFPATNWTQVGGATIDSPYPKPILAAQHRGEWQRPTGGNTSCRYDALPSGCLTWGAASSVIFRNQCEGTPSALYGVSSGFVGNFIDVGGACGAHPQQYLVGYPSGSSPASSVFNLRPDVRAKGWSRRLVTDVQCREGIGGATHTVRAESFVYFERLVSAKIRIPECAEGEIPTRLLTSRVPTGVTCSSFVACWGDASIVTSYAMPTELTATATAPDWALCLIVGNDCGDPVMDEGVCVWGGFEISGESCTATELSEPVGSDVGQVVPIENTVGEPVNTGELSPAPSGPGGGDPGTEITVNVPINDGDGDRAVCPPGGGEVLCIDDASDGECFPEGWGWMNPVEWVERPVKCALVWAFVPSDDFLSDAAGGEGVSDGSELDEDSLYYPLALIAELGDVLADEVIVTDAEVSAGSCGISMPFAGLQSDGTGATSSTEVMGMTSISANVCDGTGMTNAVRAARALSLVGTSIAALWMAIRWLRGLTGLGVAKGTT